MPPRPSDRYLASRSATRTVFALVLALAIATGCASRSVVGQRAIDSSTQADEALVSVDAETAAADPDQSPPADSSTLGEVLAERVARLIDECDTGSDLACDLLYTASDVGSPDEATASSCGGRGRPATGFCTDGIDPDGDNLWFSVDSPALPDLVERCQGGDMTACDFLYFRSPIGTDHEAIGTTCGGRVEVAVPDCRTLFAE